MNHQNPTAPKRAFSSATLLQQLSSTKADLGPLLGGPWDLGTTYSWAHNLTSHSPKWASRGYPQL